MPNLDAIILNLVISMEYYIFFQYITLVLIYYDETIDTSMFCECGKMAEITILKSVTSIRLIEFLKCESLQFIKVSEA